MENIVTTLQIQYFMVDYKVILEKYRFDNKLSQKEMAYKLGISQQVYSNYESGKKKKLDKDFIVKYKEVTGINLLEATDIYEGVNEELTNYGDFKKKYKTDYPFYVPFVDVENYKNYTANIGNPEFLNSLTNFPLPPDIDSRGTEWRYFEVDDDSMTPELNRGDMVLATIVPPIDWTDLGELHTYAIVTDDRILIRRVTNEPGREIMLVSVSDLHFPLIIPLDHVREIWKIRKHVRNEFPPAKNYNLDEIRKRVKRL